MTEGQTAAPSRWKRLVARANHPVDIASLVFVRIAFGFVMLWEVSRYLDAGWVADYYIQPDFNFTYFGFDWIAPWGGEGMYVHFVALGVLATLIMTGFAYRLATILFFLGITYTFLLEHAHYLNHFYLICLLSFLMMLVPAHRSCSVGTWLGWVKPSNTTPFWTVWILRFQVGVVYFYGGIAKLNGDWLRGEPMRTWLSARADMPVVGPLFEAEAVIWVFVFGGIILDLAIVPLLMWRRTRAPGFVLIVAFHLANSVVWSIGIFPFLAIAMTTIFFEPDWARRIFRIPEYPKSSATPSPGWRAEFITGFVVLYAAAQALIPLRHYLYPGPVVWTEEGHNFSWRMKLRSRWADTTFYLTDPNSGKRFEVDMRRFLSSRQIRKMSSKPDLILQFARLLKEKTAEEGITDVKITARCTVSINGREPKLFFDPDLDLAALPRSLAPKKWLYPFDSENPLPADPQAVEDDS